MPIIIIIIIIINLSKSNKSDFSEQKIFSKSIMQSFTLHEIAESEVSLAISDVKNNSSPEIDGISPKFIKMASLDSYFD